MRGTGQTPRQAQFGIRHRKLLPHRPGTELMGLVRQRFPVQRSRLQILHQQFQVDSTSLASTSPAIESTTLLGT